MIEKSIESSRSLFASFPLEIPRAVLANRTAGGQQMKNSGAEIPRRRRRATLARALGHSLATILDCGGTGTGSRGARPDRSPTGRCSSFRKASRRAPAQASSARCTTTGSTAASATCRSRRLEVTQPNRSVVKVSFIDSSGVTRETQTTTARTVERAWQFTLQPARAGLRARSSRVSEVDPDGPGRRRTRSATSGSRRSSSTPSAPRSAPRPATYVPGDQVPVTGTDLRDRPDPAARGAAAARTRVVVLAPPRAPSAAKCAARIGPYTLER